MALLSTAWVKVAFAEGKYIVHLASERGLGDIRETDGKTFAEKVSESIFAGSPQIEIVKFDEEKGVPVLPVKEIHRSPAVI